MANILPFVSFYLILITMVVAEEIYTQKHLASVTRVFYIYFSHVLKLPSCFVQFGIE